MASDCSWTRDALLPRLGDLFGRAQVSVIDWTATIGPEEDMLLMSRMRHTVISNSTRGALCARLNPNPGKVAVAPEPWTRSVSAEIVPTGWTRVSNLADDETPS